jgi:hypothetical protein
MTAIAVGGIAVPVTTGQRGVVRRLRSSDLLLQVLETEVQG